MKKKIALSVPSKYFVAALYLAGYPTSVLAADLVLGSLTIPWMKFVYVLIMAFWGALAALLQRLSKGIDAKRWVLSAIRDMVNATLAAVLAFLACEQLAIPPAIEAIAFTLAGYGGARAMESFYKTFINKVSNVVEGVNTKQG